LERTKEKIKDLVEIKRYEGIANFWNDPVETLDSYHFTDGLAELMARWLTTAAGSGTIGNCRAIAGYRGVGKSHFLSVLGALAANPELRIKVSDQLVAGGVQQLLRRHYPVASVRRGTQISFLDEVADAFAKQFGKPRSEFDGDLVKVLTKARALSGDLPLVLIVDTAPDREGHVRRNDGPELAEIAEASRKLGIFLGVALDDDIAGADGDNVAISAQFEIDYLDQEHLHRAVNAKVFLKDSRKQAIIRSVYDAIATSVKGFRWSEERFTALYPLHPITLELTPSIRRFLPSFSILKFASASSDKILSRPADSLLGIEDLFDSSEPEFRKNSELDSAFKAYDSIRETVIDTLAIKERHKIRLILKGLFLLSLDGTGTSSRELGAVLMLPEAIDDRIDDIDRILDSFAACVPNGVTVDESNPRSRIFAISTGSDDRNVALTQWLDEQPESLAAKVFLDAIGLFYPEFADKRYQCDGKYAVRISLEWRGSLRTGLLLFGNADASTAEALGHTEIEWEAFFNFDSGKKSGSDSRRMTIDWKPELLSSDDKRILLTMSALATSATVRASFGENLATAQHASISAARRVVDRAIFENASLGIEGFDYNFSEQARNAVNLKGTLSTMLEPIFEARYPQHPYFGDVLTPEGVDLTIKNVVNSGFDVTGDAEFLARNFAEPLGLVECTRTGTRRLNKDELRSVPATSLIFELLSSAEESPIADVFDRLHASPFGLAPESCYLVLAAMASSNCIELVTGDGNRINGRSIDLKIDWDRVSGIATPRDGTVSNETVLKWAREVSASPDIKALKNGEDRSRVIAALVDIANGYELSTKHNLSDPWCQFMVDTNIWKHSNRVSENYELIIDTVNEALAGTIQLEACLGQISNSFGDRTDLFKEAKRSAAIVEAAAKHRSEIEYAKEYVGRVGLTGDAEVEESKNEFADRIKEFSLDPSETSARGVGHAFEKFKRLYADVYLSEHSARESLLKEKVESRRITSSDDAKRLETYFAIDDIRKELEPKLRKLRRESESIGCRLNPKVYLEKQPHCVCSFHLGEHDDINELHHQLTSLIADAQQAFEQKFAEYRSNQTSDEILDVSSDRPVASNGFDLGDDPLTLPSGVLTGLVSSANRADH